MTKTEANKLRGLVSRVISRERALWALHTDNRNGCDFGEAYTTKVHTDLANARDRLNAHIRDCTVPK